MINGLSRSVAEDHVGQKHATNTLSTKYSKVSADLDSWKQILSDKIEENYKHYKQQLHQAYDNERLRLKKGHDKTREALDMSQKLTHIAKHLKRTGNPRDLQNLKDNMTENVDTLNLLLDQRAKFKRSCAETWSYAQPNLAPESFAYLIGKLDVKTFDMLHPSRQSYVHDTQVRATDPGDSPVRESSTNISSLENLMVQIEPAQLEEKYMLMHTFSSKTYNDKSQMPPDGLHCELDGKHCGR